MPASVPDPAGLIHYDPRLLNELLRDHAELGWLFGRIGDTAKAGDAGEARSLLITFKARLKAHIVAENVRFYDYLEQSLTSGSDTARMVSRYRREMTNIAGEVLAFIDRYQSSAFGPSDRLQFAAEYEVVGRALEHRLDSEEDNLYRLYRPS